MAKEYLVQSGDTLGAIAKRFGTDIGNITGFRSGNPDLIFPGEKLSINTPTVTQDQASGMNIKDLSIALAKNEPKSRASFMRGEFGQGDNDTWSNYESRLADATKQKESAFEALQGFRTKRYNELVAERGLDNNRSEIEMLDSQIAEKKQQRDDALATAKRNPGASAATITGEVRGITDQLNASINNLIEQRNARAGSYNSMLSEIEGLVGKEAGDLESSLGFYTGEEEQASATMQAYQKALIEELRRQEDREFSVGDDLRNFQQALELAQARKASSMGTVYKPPTSYQEWSLAEKPGSYQEWLQPEDEIDKLIRENREKQLLEQTEETKGGIWNWLKSLVGK